MLQEGGGEPPKGSLGSVVDTNFGSLEALIQKMNAEGAALQGSGWVVSLHFCFFRRIVYCSIGSSMVTGECLVSKILILYHAFCLHFLLCMQWLALDKELKRLAIETTSNQVIYPCFMVNSLIVSFLLIIEADFV